jgi:3-oxoacyl-[acyl-carrier protein] reductase|tara:strand:+ start:4895 stop:5626 length:732 start_codon:yes stop_codon:yes gene_type:complete
MKRIVLVTGGSRGIGKATCLELAKKDFYVLINYNTNHDAALNTLSIIKNEGGNGELLQFDVTNRDQLKKVLQKWKEENPDKYISALVNNAGIKKDTVLPLMKFEDWNQVINTSLNGFFNVTKEILPLMLKKKEGQIVNVVSVSGQKGTVGQTNYSAAKAGVIGATKALAQEVGRKNVRVNAVAPGFIKTDMTEGINEVDFKKQIPLNRFGEAEEVAKCISFLLSKDSSYITGEILSINGGLYS